VKNSKIFRILVEGYKRKYRLKKLENRESFGKGIEGISLPMVPSRVRLKSVKFEEIGKLKCIYPLVPRNPHKEEPILAYAKIEWDERRGKYIYNVVEPPLTKKLKTLIFRIREMLEQRLDIDFSKLRKSEALTYLERELDSLINYFKFMLSSSERKILRYYIYRDLMGLGKIEPLMQDPNIEEISCDGVGIPIFILHKNPEIGFAITNIVFNDSEELNTFIVRLSQLCGKNVSAAQPLVKGILPDGSKLHATLGTDIAKRGSNFTIHKLRGDPLTPIHLLNYKTLDIRALAYLWMVIDFGKSILIGGGARSGKTTLLNALSLFIRPEKKIISIEEIPELRLPHLHWIPFVTRSSMSNEVGRSIDMFELLKGSIEQEPDYIIVGELKGKEARLLFQQIPFGYHVLATILSEDMNIMIKKLTSPPFSLSHDLLANLELIIFIQKVKIGKRYTKRISEIIEIIGLNEKKNTLLTNPVFRWNPTLDIIEIVGKSYLLKNICEITKIKEGEILEEFNRRYAILRWMKEKGIVDYRSVYRVITSYYTNPTRVLTLITRV